VLRKTFGPKREEVRGDWRKLRNKPCNFHISPNIIRGRGGSNEGRDVNVLGANTNAYRGFVQKN
jgi:hypothetical protein